MEFLFCRKMSGYRLQLKKELKNLNKERMEKKTMLNARKLINA